MTGLLFDLDGTLLNTLDDLADSLNHTLAAFGYPTRTLEETRRFVGNGALELIRKAIPAGEDPQPVLKAFQTYYQSHCQVKTAPYPGILAALHQLHSRYPIAVVSNKPDAAAKALCALHFPGIYALGESPACPRKPAGDMVFAAMAAIGVETCLYIGDSEVDVATARNAGVPCLSVTWGFRDEAELKQAGANHFCTAPENLPDTIEKLLGGTDLGQ